MAPSFHMAFQRSKGYAMSKTDDGKKEVKVFNCEVRLNGDLLHTIQKNGITDREIRVIRAIHGNGGVAKVEPAGTARINEQEELYELAIKYSKNINPAHGVNRIEKIFGVQLNGFTEWNMAREDEQERIRDELHQKQNAEAARLSAARERAEAAERLRMTEERTQPAVAI